MEDAIKQRRAAIKTREEVIEQTITAWTFYTDDQYVANRIAEQEEIIAAARENISRIQTYANNAAYEIYMLQTEKQELKDEYQKLAPVPTPAAPRVSVKKMSLEEQAAYYKKMLAELESQGISI